MKVAKFYSKEGNNIRCGLCNHKCLIGDNQTGICRVRINLNDRLFSLVYGKPVSIGVDPVEKKPLFHFLPGTLTYSLGTYGCNFHCANCQNWSISQATKDDIRKLPETKIPPEKIISDALENKCKSISYTYNEPTIFTEYALDIMKLARKNGLKNIWVSNGFMSQECLKEIMPYLDAINVDVKSFDDSFYQNNCGGRLAPIMQNLIALKENNIHIEITTLIIPKLSDNEIMLEKMCFFIFHELGADTPWHISRFFGDISWQLTSVNTTGLKSLETAFNIGKKMGLKYIYFGNVPGTDLENTYCQNCQQIIIRRIGYEIHRFDKRGMCPKCGNDIKIVL